MKRTLVLPPGPFENQNVVLAGYRFVEGRCTVEGSEEELENLSKYMSRCWGVTHGGSAVSESTGSGSTDAIPGGVRPDGAESSSASDDKQPGAAGAAGGSEGSVPVGHGHKDAGVPEESKTLESRIRAAVDQLDPSRGDHWTNNGLPAVAAVETLVGEKVTREAINAAAPGILRSVPQ